MAGEVPFYAIQPAFTAGEVSEEVASRVDLDKYQLALLLAENAIIRPYGPVYKRPGSLCCGQVHAGGDVLLYRFEYDVALAYLLEIGERYVRIWKDGALLCRAGVPIVLSTPYAAADLHRLRFVQSVDVLYICSGVFPVMQLARFSEADWRFSEVLWSYPPFGDVNPDEEATISPSAAVGDVTLTAARDVFSSADVGDLMKFSQYVNGDTVTMEAEGSEESRPVAVGKTWKVITHGSWSGKVTVQHSADDGASWVDLRTYSGRDDYNPTESGDVDAYSLLRIRAGITKGRCYVSLSSFPYRHEGYVRLTGVTDARHASAHVVRRLGGTEATADWFRGAWSKVNGYPRCAAFFQDRLCFGGNARYPQRLWMSRSGDYEDFSVDKEQGAVTDDSAVSVDLLSRQAYSISHMDVGNDLLVFTDGNTWSISGSETVKPSNVTPKNQEGYGASDVPPLRVGNRVVYVQRRGAMIRDTGYSYESDGYVGADLTLLAKHLLRGHRVVSAAYAQEPDSLLYFVREDGVLLCLTYVQEQKVFAWSHFVTHGKYRAVCAVNEAERDVVYVVVERRLGGAAVLLLERFAPMPVSASQQDYVMADAAFVECRDVPSRRIPGADVLAGEEVVVLADGYFHERMKLSEDAQLPAPARCVMVGLPYVMRLTQPNFDAGMTPAGSLQGRRKLISTAILRLVRSFGGAVGSLPDLMNAIVYDDERMELGEDVLYSGDISVTLSAGGWDTQGRVYINHDVPYPFSLSALIREVSFGG